MSSTSSRRSKGQVQQVFLFLSAVIVILATVWLGASLFGSLAQTSCDAGDAQFKESLQRQFTANSEYGSRSTVAVPAPCDALRLCFIDATRVASPDSESFTADDSAITQIIRNGGKVNIFLRGRENLVQVGFDERIVVDNAEGYLCYNATRGDFEMRIEGGGRFLALQ